MMKYFLYHKVPLDLKGEILYPLNELKTVFPEAYEREVAKYEGRSQLLEVRIPVLDCLWNDVIHLTAVEPEKIKKALIDAGHKNDFEMKFFKIDPMVLEKEKSIVYLYKQKGLENISREDNFEAFDLAKLSEYSELPEETMSYYVEMIGSGKKPLLYHKIPHIFYKGSIDVSGLETIVV